MKQHEYTTLIVGDFNDENGENCLLKNREHRLIDGRLSCSPDDHLFPDTRDSILGTPLYGCHSWFVYTRPYRAHCTVFSVWFSLIQCITAIWGNQELGDLRPTYSCRVKQSFQRSVGDIIS